MNVDQGIAQFVLIPHLEPFLARHPELSIELEVRDRMGDLVRDGFDVAVRFGVPVRRGRNFGPTRSAAECKRIPPPDVRIRQLSDHVSRTVRR